MKPILQVQNLVFLPINSRNTFITGKQKYIAGSTVSGAIFLDEVYTEEEVRAKYPNVEERQHMSEID